MELSPTGSYQIESRFEERAARRTDAETPGIRF
jgi:hypothetical protein